jgi:hypothetical protein
MMIWGVGWNACLDPIKNQALKFLRLPNVIFNDIDLIVPVGTGKTSSVLQVKKN